MHDDEMLLDTVQGGKNLVGRQQVPITHIRIFAVNDAGTHQQKNDSKNVCGILDTWEN